MENFRLDRNITVLCVQAKTFPDGIMDAFHTLINLHPSIQQRSHFGISYSDKNGEIIYKAAAQEEFEGEGEMYNCETFTIRKGDYTSETIRDFSKNIPAIGSTFQQLLQHPQLDKNGACVEWYKGNDVICMVRLNDKN